MKKYIFALCLIFGIILTNSVSVFADSADYLPGGDNYLNYNNFVLSGGYLNTITPFVIKGNQDYRLTMTDDYRRMFGPGEEVIQVTYYEDQIVLSSFWITTYDLIQSADFVYVHNIIHTPMDANRMSLKFLDCEDFFLIEQFSRAILEEGTLFDGYEDYIEGEIVDTASPEFENVNDVISYVHAPILVEDILASLTAYDVIDQDVSSRISVLSDSYTENCTVLGTYPIVFQVSDLSGNTTTTTLYVTVIDVLKPVFPEIEPVVIPYPQIYSIEQIQALLNASDNYDGDITEEITLTNDGYSAFATVVGDYEIRFQVSDSSGNTSYLDVLVKVVDQEAPIITGVSNIVIGYDETISHDELKALLVAVDNYDEILTLELEMDTYSANRYVLGTYEVTYSATDTSGNITEFTFHIDVVDEIGPILYFNTSIIQTYQDNVLSLEDFLHLLNMSGELTNVENTSVIILYDTYTSHASTPGVYHLKIRLTTDGFSTEKEFQILVKEKDEYIFTSEPENKDFWDIFKDNLIFVISGFALVLTNLIWFIVFKRR